MKIHTQRFLVPNDLQSVLEGMWTYQLEAPNSETSPTQFCMPGGMIELLFHVSPNTHQVLTGAKWTTAPEAMIIGLRQGPVFFTAQGGTSIFGLNIKPEAFVFLFNKPVCELAQGYADMSNFFAANEVGNLQEQIVSAPDDHARARIVIQFFRERLTMRGHQERHYLQEAMEHIRVSIGTYSVDEVAEKVFVGKRQLQRAFQEQFGVSPKLYGRIVRFKSAYDFVKQHPKASWVDVTYHFGYSDQSHFIRDFKEFTGNNPTGFLSSYEPQSNMPFALNVCN